MNEAQMPEGAQQTPHRRSEEPSQQPTKSRHQLSSVGRAVNQRRSQHRKSAMINARSDDPTPQKCSPQASRNASEARGWHGTKARCNNSILKLTRKKGTRGRKGERARERREQKPGTKRTILKLKLTALKREVRETSRVHLPPTGGSSPPARGSALSTKNPAKGRVHPVAKPAAADLADTT